MTDCNLEPIIFSSVGGRQVVADFNGGSITSDAGALLLREVDRHLGLIDRLDAVIPDPRDPSRVTHRQRHMLAQRIFGIALGSYCQMLWMTPAAQAAFALTPSKN